MSTLHLLVPMTTHILKCYHLLIPQIRQTLVSDAQNKGWESFYFFTQQMKVLIVSSSSQRNKPTMFLNFS